MNHYNRHIAWLLIIIFALFGAEKINFSVEQTCDKKLMYCPTANMYVYTVYKNTSRSSNPDTKDTDTHKVTTIACETFFINQIESAIYTKQKVTYNYSPFYYKHVIHSTPYIPLADPPPIV